MTISVLSDLDELILTVRNPTSKQYVQDAINAYRGRAFRASIISTWISVTYDIIAKIRELASQNDKNAIQYITQIDKAIENKNIQQLSNIEDELLKKAYEEFAFVSKQEFDDLDRLKRDRNLCAHPAFVDTNYLFQPTPELVRTHIVHSILHLLKHPPVQGKVAIDRFYADIKSESFPSSVEAITEFIHHKYLSRAKQTLVRNLIVSVLKTMLFNEAEFRAKQQILVNCLIAINSIESYTFEQVMRQELSSIYDGLTDERRLNLFRLLGAIPTCWAWLDLPAQIQSKQHFQQRLKDDDDSIRRYIYECNIFSALAVDELNRLALQEFPHLNWQSQCAVIERSPRPEFIDRGIAIFERTGSYSDAEFIGQKVLLPLAPIMKPEHIQKVLLAAIQNPRNQILPAAGMPKILELFFNSTSQYAEKTVDIWQQLMNNIGAEKYRYADYANLRKQLNPV